VRENRTQGSARGWSGNWPSYLDRLMKIIAKFLRYFAKLKFKLFGYATINDIQTDKFNEILKGLIEDGWKRVYT
jgi:hypothetical protein